MKRNFGIILTILALVVGVAFANGFLVNASEKPQSLQKERGKMKTMTIKWQRLVDNAGQTCDRCGTTQAEVQKAYTALRKSLALLDIDVVLDEKMLDKATAAKNIAESNRIWIDGKPLETWLGAKPGSSDCSSCGSLVGANVECRTVVVGGIAYESIPSAMIVKAGLLAAADMIGAEAAVPPSAGCGGGSCGTGGCGR